MFQFPAFALSGLCIQPEVPSSACTVRVGFPIRKSLDQRLLDSFPGLIAAYRVLHRLVTPRHPPCTLSSLITSVVGPFSRTDGLMLKRLGARHIPKPPHTQSTSTIRNSRGKPGSGPARNVFGDSLHLQLLSIMRLSKISTSTGPIGLPPTHWHKFDFQWWIGEYIVFFFATQALSLNFVKFLYTHLRGGDQRGTGDDRGRTGNP